jgi:hypothetical protein
MMTEEGAKAVLVELDGIARDVCHYDYGLPLFTDGAMERMLDVVAGQIREAVAEERERAAKVAESRLARLTPRLAEVVATAIREGKE